MTFDQGGIVLVDDHLLHPTQVGQLQVLELNSQVFEDRCAADHDGDILQHRLPTVAVTGSLNRHAAERTSQLVDHQGRQGLALNFLSDDQQGLAGVDHLLEHRDQVLDVRDLLLVNQDVAVFQHRLHRRRVCDEVGREVSAVKLHPLDDRVIRLKALALFDGDHAILANLFHRVREDVANLRITVRGDGRDLGDRLLVATLDRHGLQLGDHVLDRLVHAPLHLDRVDARNHRPQTLNVDRFRHDGRRRGAITSHVGGLAGDLLHHLRPHIFELVRQFDLAGHGHAVLGHGRRTKALLQNHVPPTGTEGHPYRLGQLAHARANFLLGFLVERNHLRHEPFSSGRFTRRTGVNLGNRDLPAGHLPAHSSRSRDDFIPRNAPPSRSLAPTITDDRCP